MVDKELTNLFGLDYNEVSAIHNTLDDLRKSKLGMVIGKCIFPIDVSINRGEYKSLKLGDELVMSIGMFDKLQYTELPDKTKNISFIPSDKKFHELYKPYNGQDLTNKTLLAWRTGGIGDIIFIQPCLIFLKKKYPTCKIWFACSSNYISMLHGCDYIDDIFGFPYQVSKILSADYHCTFEGVIERCKEAETLNAYKLFAKWMGLEIPDNELRPILYTKKNNDKYVKRMMSKLDIPENNFIYLQPKASVLLRSPGIKHWLLVIAELLLNKKIVVFNHEPHEHDLLEAALRKHIKPDGMKYVRIFSKYSTNISIAMSLMKYAKLVIAPDSSSIHLAAALGKQCYGIYAPFPGEIRMSTYKKCKWTTPEIVLGLCPWGGRNCCQHQRLVCDYNKFNISPCFDLIDYRKVREEINGLLE
jgi:ADP-heptose:LPS heptosyltransferase